MADTTKLHALLDATVAQGASDLHLSEGVKPTLRVSGALVPLINEPVLLRADMDILLAALMPPERLTLFKQRQEMDLAYEFGEKARFRVNVMVQRGRYSVSMRLVPLTIRSLTELGFPEDLGRFAAPGQGFFLVVGPAGQGKTTTLAALIEKINRERTEHIVTIEDPIEYMFESKQSVIEQREVGVDTESFSSALQHVFRQDINVLMVGEMRTPETMAAAVTAAETGHMVYSTLHTNNAAQTIDRIIDSFPPVQQEQIRAQLAGSLAGIVSQRLLPRISGGLIPAYELLVATPAVRNLIRERRIHEIQTLIETGAQEGMIDLNRSLAELVRRGEITPEAAYSRSLNPKLLERLL